MNTVEASQRLHLDSTNEDINALIELDNYQEYEEFHFFWKNESPFSQWYKRSFHAMGLDFTSAEQYMMYNKALLFEDYDIAAKILSTNNVKKQKELGRQVQNFDLDVWQENAKRIVYEGNYYKFSQNLDLKSDLLKTDGKLLVEASPNDEIWGVGLAEDNPLIEHKANWQGTNWLGCILTQLREDLVITNWPENIINS